jgi:hypothetical protein
VFDSPERTTWTAPVGMARRGGIAILHCHRLSLTVLGIYTVILLSLLSFSVKMTMSPSAGSAWRYRRVAQPHHELGVSSHQAPAGADENGAKLTQKPCQL